MIVLAAPRYLDGRYGAGNWKDLQATRLLLTNLGVPFEEVAFDEEAPGDFGGPGRDVSDLVVHYTWWPEAMQRVRERAPWVRLHVRAHNAEALQHAHRSQLRPLPTAANLRSLYGAVRLGVRDMRCRRIADTVLGISAWDNDHYWSRLPGGAKVRYLPYFSPWPDLRRGVRPRLWAERGDSILCMPGARDPIGASMIRGFVDLARALAATIGGKRWRFQLTGGALGGGAEVTPSEDLELLGSVEPWDLLCGARAVALLTPLGFGTKTTIVDALAAGCHVLVHPKLAERLPVDVLAPCTIVDPVRPEQVGRLAAVLDAPPRANGLNERLKLEGLKVLSEVLGR